MNSIVISALFMTLSGCYCCVYLSSDKPLGWGFWLNMISFLINTGFLINTILAVMEGLFEQAKTSNPGQRPTCLKKKFIKVLNK